jgi:hypothetical protein
MNHTANGCAVCKQAARVRILETYVAGRPVIRHFCFECADRYFGQLSQQDPPVVRRASLGALLILAGLLLGLVAIVADHLGIHGSPGFGWYKQTGLLTGSLLICLAAFWRIDIIGVLGILMLGLAAGANLLGLAGRDGFGWKQQVAMAAGLLLVVAGTLVRRRSCRQAERPSGVSPQIPL